MANLRSDAFIFIGSRDRKVYALEARTGPKRREFQTGGSVSSPAVWVSGWPTFRGTLQHIGTNG